MIYFTSDFHFGHNKDFIYKSRGFTSVKEMDETILENFSEILTEDDTLYILGDLMLGNNEKGIYYLKQIPGYKHIILGNHDADNRINLYRTIPNTEVHGYATMFYYNKRFTAYLSHYPTLVGNYDDNKTHKIINLCGHVHTQDKFYDADKGSIYHVEVDAHDCKPVSIEQIIEDIKMRKSVPSGR